MMQLRTSRLGGFAGSLATLALLSATGALRPALAGQQATELDDQQGLTSVLIKRSEEPADEQPAADNDAGDHAQAGDRALAGKEPVPGSHIELAEEPPEPQPTAQDEAPAAAPTIVEAENLADQSPEQPADQTQKQPADQSPERPADQSPEHSADQTQEQPADQEQEPQAKQEQEQDTTVVKAAAAMFKGIKPGESTAADLKKDWGEPVEVIDEPDGPVYVYSVKPFDRIEITVVDGVVASILINLKRSFDLASLTRRLQLDHIEAVDVLSGEGDAMGRSFPERGVLFSFVRGESPRQVSQILLEPIDSEPFVLRVKSHLHGPYTQNLRDLKFAIQLDSKYAEPHWLKAQILLVMGEVSRAEEAAARAVELGDNPVYRLTWAACLAQRGSYDKAVQATQAVLDTADLPPVVKARGLLQMGDLVASADERDFGEALKLHTEAINVADPFALDRHVAVRRAAKEILVDAHLAVAHDIGWGNWRQKATIVPKWISRATAYAEEMIDNEEGSLELRLRIAQRSLAALAGFKPSINPAKWIELAKTTADELSQNSSDSHWNELIDWQLGMAYYHALAIDHIRGEVEQGLKFGRLAEKYLKLGANSREVVPDSDYLVGRLYFQIGVIHAIHRKDHVEAAAWYDKASPRIATPIDNSAVSSPRQQGEALVSMGVSYWQIGKRDKAVSLTEQGVQIIEQAVASSGLGKSALTIAYGNLAAMHDVLGHKQQARDFSALADASKATRRR